MNKLFIYILLIIAPFSAFSQSQKQWLKYADKSFEEKDFYGASLYYREAMLIDSSNLYVVYRYAESLRHYNNYKLGERYYKFVFLIDKGRTYPDALFWLSMMQKNNAKYTDARKNFISYTKSNKDKDSYFYKKSQQEIKSCEFAMELIGKPVKANIYNLGDSLNSVNAEFAAILANDSVLFISFLESKGVQVKKEKKEKRDYTSIRKAERFDTLWMRKQKLDTVINNPMAHSANGCFSPDGKKFYFTRCDDEMKCKIYVSEIADGAFGIAKLLNNKINDPSYTSTQPYLTNINNEEVLFFTSNRDKGLGRMDIWYSIKKEDDFTEPVNAGPMINTIDDDVSPFYDTTSRSLYFSSPWHYGLGGFDIFKSVGTPDSFSAPQNIGYPINSSANDLYFSVSDSSLNGFLTSNRIGAFAKENETCCNDIWSFRIIPEKPKKDTTILLAKTNPLEELKKFLPIKLYFHNDEPDPRTKDTLTKLSYTESYLRYKDLVNEYKENYSKGLSEEKKPIAEDSVQSFFDNHVDKNYHLLEEFSETLLKQLEKGYKLDLTVKGHASPLANTAYNVNLTLRRISSLENFLSTYKNGALLPYLTDSAANGGSLKLIRIPFGEYKSETYVSDNANDKKNSVYSISAALNRNIEIVSLTLEHKDTLSARMAFRKEVYDFGTLKAGTKVIHSFKFKNSGKAPLIISGMENSCACLTVKTSPEPVGPGGKGEIEITLDTKTLKGKQVQTVTLITNGVPERKELSLTGDVR